MADYEWDSDKAESNARKHQVRFEDAAGVFDDPLGLFFEDSHHGDGRYILIGRGNQLQVLCVVHIAIGSGPVRIISARKATTHERRRYEEGL